MQEFQLLPVLIDYGPASFAFDFGRYLIASTMMAAIVWKMRRSSLASRDLQPRKASAGDIRREFLSSVQTCLVYVSITLFMVWGVGAGIFQRIEGSFGWGVDLAILAGIILAHDAYFYWVHRAMHHPKLFKTFHRHHHRSTAPTPFAAYSFAIPEAFVMAAFVPLWQLFVATPGWVLFAFLNFQIIRNVMGHAGIELMPRWWLSTPLTRWVNTTTHHELHHGGGFTRNYGLYFTFWDRLMSTEHRDYADSFTRATRRREGASSTEPTPSPAL
jgi:Delta7-sterol 5-desaturase